MNPIFKEAAQAFEDALSSGRLSDNPKADNYVADYMYMGTYDGLDAFKNIFTRQYLS